MMEKKPNAQDSFVNSNSRRRLFINIALLVLVLGLSWSSILGAIIWRFGSTDSATKSDCIIVLGTAVQGSTPSPVFEERIRHGVSLYHNGLAPKILFTGGVGNGQLHSESSIGRSVALVSNVPESAVFIEEISRTTQQNLAEARILMQKQGLKSAIIVSDPLHMRRAMVMAKDLEIVAVSSPTPTTRYRTLKTKLGFLFREIFFIQYYFITGN